MTSNTAAARGASFRARYGERGRNPYDALYLCMGWMAVFAIGLLSRVLPPAAFFRLPAGGVLYSPGGVLYALKWPGRDNPKFGFHEIFHPFVMAGSVCRCLMIWQIAL